MTIVPVALEDSVLAVLHVPWEKRGVFSAGGCYGRGEGARDSASVVLLAPGFYG